MAQQAKYKVLVRKNGKEAVVRPPFDTADAGNNNGFVVVNRTAKDILVSLPDGVFDFNQDNLADPGQLVTVQAGKTEIIRVAPDAILGLGSFQIFCLETFSFAQANSDPEFIIE
jgi:hypothetical protein